MMKFKILQAGLLAAALSNIALGQVALDPRIGPNIRLGQDPGQLPSNLRAQAEPQITRSFSNPNLVVATFQEGRYTDGGAIASGYSVSTDGGLTWTRGLVPRLTQITGGIFLRASDPVAAIGLDGSVLLANLGILDDESTDVLVSRSTDQGLTFSDPVPTFQRTDGFPPDKPWLAVNTFAGSPHAGRIGVTFNRDIPPDDLRFTYSDNGGRSWSNLQALNPASGSTQPFYLPDGTLAIVYIHFLDTYAQTTSRSRIEVLISPDGGDHFLAPRLTPAVFPPYYEDPVARDGWLTPSACTDRETGTIYVAFQGMSGNKPSILVMRSADQGVTWSTPVRVNDTPGGKGVFNPAIAASPDGSHITIAFYDKRNQTATSGDYFYDLYLAESFDGGTTWQPNLRLSDVSSDLRLAPLTGTGYMVGDYLGIVPSLGPDIPGLAVWIDTRTGNPDPFVVQIHGPGLPPSPPPAQAPTINTQPAGQTVNFGSSATFSVSASGTGPLSYQWRFNGANIPGATSSAYTIGSVQSSDAGSYDVVVSNSAGSVTSLPASLTVLISLTLVNGSFEADMGGWVESGNQTIITGTPDLPTTDQAKGVLFNSGQRNPDAVLAQSFATTPGQSYQLTFDLGAFSLVNTDEQRLQVTVQGASTVLSTVVTVHAPGNGTIYVSQRLSFVADSSQATLTFTDVSPTTENVDMLLDNVRLTALVVQDAGILVNGSFEAGQTGWITSGNQRVITGIATIPASDQFKTVLFNSGQRTPNGVLTQTFATAPGQTYELSFDLGAFSFVNTDEQRLRVTVQGASTLLSTVATVRAPGNGTSYSPRSFRFVADGTAATLTFEDVSLTSDSIDMLLDNVNLTQPAVEAPLEAFVVANGSFEADYSGWTSGGNQKIHSGTAAVPVSDQLKGVIFNAGQTAPDGVISQTLVTTPGQSYVLTFDLGAFSFVSTIPQQMEVSVQGTSTLLSKMVTVYAPGNGTAYQSQRLEFIADSQQAVLTFQDVSSVTDSVDMLLDNVRVTEQLRVEL